LKSRTTHSQNVVNNFYKKIKNQKPDKMITDEIIGKLKEHTTKDIDGKGYITSMNPEDNLLQNVANWNIIKTEIGKGQGSELKADKNGRMKFCALHSSSALCVNNFAMFKQNHKDASFLQYSNFIEAVFEKKLSTGISTPNLDFYLKNSKTIIGIESKFTEYLTSKSDHTKENLSKYFMREELNFLPRLFDSIILNYINCPDKMFLNVAQLIKHSIGLLKNKGDKEAILVYIYWQPKRWDINGAFQKIYEQHNKEIEDFAKRINKFITFKHLSYSDLWEEYKEYDILEKEIELIKAKYDIEI
jgi:hypothetical protein